MIKFTSEMVTRIINEFPQCIERGDNHLASHPPTYFHKSFCMRGAGLGTEELVRRMCERWEEIERHEIVINPVVLMTLPCRDCHKQATGTGWVAYHNKAAILEIFPLCEIHSDFDDKDNRPHGYIHGIVSMDINTIQPKLRAY